MWEKIEKIGRGLGDVVKADPWSRVKTGGRLGEASWTALPSKKFQQNCPESLSQNQLSEVSWVSQEWNCLCNSAPALVGWEQLRKVWHVVNLQRLPVMGGLQVHSHGGHIYIGFIWNTQEQCYVRKHPSLYTWSQIHWKYQETALCYRIRYTLLHIMSQVNILAMMLTGQYSSLALISKSYPLLFPFNITPDLQLRPWHSRINIDFPVCLLVDVNVTSFWPTKIEVLCVTDKNRSVVCNSQEVYEWEVAHPSSCWLEYRCDGWSLSNYIEPWGRNLMLKNDRATM